MRCIEYADKLKREGWKVLTLEGNILKLHKNGQIKEINLLFDTSTKFVGSGTDRDPHWTNPSYITADDDSPATNSITHLNFSPQLIGYNCGFSITSGSTIDGITVVVERKADTADRLSFGVGYEVDGYAVLGFWDGANLTQKGTAKTDNTKWNVTYATTTFGSSSDLWGTTWTTTDINDSTLGIELVVTNTDVLNSVLASIDYVQFTITYTLASPSTIIPQIIFI
jgi:hypothetical protein